MKLVKREKFADTTCDFFKNEDGDIFMTREQIGRALQYENPSAAIRKIHSKNKLRLDKFSRAFQVGTASGKQTTRIYNEKGIYEIVRKSDQPKADDFFDFVYEVLESIRKTGSYNLKNFLLSNPSQWEPTFPYNFFMQVMRVYNYQYDPSKNTPQWVGKFIDKYIYSPLDRNMTRELKIVRNKHEEITDEFALLHQFVTPEGRDPLKRHIERITDLLSLSRNIEQFEILYNKMFVHKNQLELYLR